MKGAECDNFKFLPLNADYTILRRPKSLSRIYQLFPVYLRSHVLSDSWKAWNWIPANEFSPMREMANRASNHLSNPVHILIDTTQTKRARRWIHGEQHLCRTSHGWMKFCRLKGCARNRSDRESVMLSCQLVGNILVLRMQGGGTCLCNISAMGVRMSWLNRFPKLVKAMKKTQVI